MSVISEGGQAFYDGLLLSESPYHDGRAIDWMDGWLEAKNATERRRVNG